MPPSVLLALAIGWLLGKGTYKRDLPPARRDDVAPPPAPPPKPADKLTKVPWPSQDTPDVAPPGLTKKQTREWADVKRAEYERQKAQQMMAEDLQRQAAQQQAQPPVQGEDEPIEE